MQAEFQSLTILPRISSCNSESNSYKVFSDIDNFIEVQADTAMDAIIKSNVEYPLKVIKSGSHNKRILHIQDLNNTCEDQIDNSETPENKEQLTENAAPPPNDVVENNEETDAANNTEDTPPETATETT